jgi:S1-C subfamily serine protease
MNEPSASRSELWRHRLWRPRLQHLRARLRRAVPFASGVLAALVALLLYNVLFPGPHQLTTPDVKNTVAQILASATPPPAFSERVYQVIQPSLVLIQTKSPGEDGKGEHSLGSGVIINDSGDILTALHVVTQATDIQLTFADGTQSSAQVTAQQPENDIAVLHADQLPAQLVPATLGNPNAMRVGDEAFVVGNPFGLYSSMSAGVISGFDRSFQPLSSTQKLHGLIQIDAAVNPGNSGGPLLNRNGEVIGIIEGIANPTDQDFFVGIGFAVTINTALGGAGGSPPY